MSGFKILSDKEHILIRPGMYIGSTSLETKQAFISGDYTDIEHVPGLVKIINEIIDNSVDEAIRTNFKHANKIDVVLKDSSVLVSDNGRGIPQDLVENNISEMIPTPVAAWTLAKAGSNFDDSDGRTTIGMNGVGSALTNFFSTKFIGKTSNGSTEISVYCSNNADDISWKSKSSSYKGTSVEFIPDFGRFGVNNISSQTKDLIRERLVSLSVSFPKIEFSFNGKKIKSSFKQYAKQYGENVIFESDNVLFLIAPSDSGFLQNSFVNGVQTSKGGTHVDYISSKIIDELIPLIKKKHKIIITPSRVKECITFVAFLRKFGNPIFDSQTKERLTNTGKEISNFIPKIDFDKIAKSIMSTKEIIDPIIELELAKRMAAELREANKAAKKASKAKVAKHIKATGGKGVTTTLFLTEGDGAIGPLLDVRDPKAHGGYPLRGKVRNTWGLTPAEQLKNSEIFDITSILGLSHGSYTKPLYDRIAILVDSDIDGIGSIFPLLLAFFYNWPELYTEQRILFCKSPLYISTNGKEEIWSYSEEEYNKYKYKFNSKWSHRYIKGLGSLEKAEYDRIINKPVFDVISCDNAKELFEMLYGDDSQLRKDWIQSANFNR